MRKEFPSLYISLMIFLFLCCGCSYSTVRRGECGWEGKLTVEIVDETTEIGIEGVDIFLGKKLIGKTNSDGCYSEKISINWSTTEIISKDQGIISSNSVYPYILFTKDGYCNIYKKVDQIGIGGNIYHEQIKLHISMRGNEKNRDSGAVVINRDIHDR